MKRRRWKLLSLALAASMTVPSAAPAMASEVSEGVGVRQEANVPLQGVEDESSSPEENAGSSVQESPAEEGAEPSAEEGFAKEGAKPSAQEGSAEEDARPSAKEDARPSTEEDASPSAEKDARPSAKEGAEPSAEKSLKEEGTGLSTEEDAEFLAGEDAGLLQDEAVQAKDSRQNDFPGLAAEYWTTKGSGTGVEFDQLKSNSIDYYIQYGDMDGKLKEQTGLEDHAGVRWTGRIKVPETGNYTFYANSDNGFRLWIDGEQLIDYWNGDSWNVVQTSKQVTLEAGKYYEFRADYFEYVGGSNVVLSWSNDKGMESTAMPTSAFYLPENFAGMYISELDTSGEGLTEGKEFQVKVKGTGFTENTSFQVVKGNGSSLQKPAALEVLSRTESEAVLKVSGLGVGSYRIKAVDGNANVASKGMLIVQPASEAGQTRAERPRADWERADFVNLNGWWDFAFDPEENGQSKGWHEADAALEQKINVPFCWESSLGGVEDSSYLGQAWYQKKVMVDSNWDGRKIFLKFGAVDWKCKLWVNGEEVGEHVGGYNAFEFDVTEYMKAGQVNTITLWVEDKGSYGDDSYPALIGKQGRNAPCGYIHTSGIWQTVGMEARSATYLDNAKAATDVDHSTVAYTLDITSDAAQELTVEYDFESKIYDLEQEKDISTGSAMKGSQKIQVKEGMNTLDLEAITVQDPKLWNYDAPNLYYGTLTVKDAKGAVLDTVQTYFGMRKVEQKYFDESLGVKYIYINNRPVYMSGLLDQGFWEEGIYTAPSEEALKYDILKMKEAGFNMIRKHLKVEDPLQYYWCDKLGMLVWQDMPHATAMVPNNAGDQVPGRQYYEECLDAMMNMNYNHPSIVAVMLFNETWGLQNAYFNGKRDVKAADGKSTKEWVEGLFHRTKALNPNLLVEDMSQCNFDHVQPTELNTYHMYPDSYGATLNAVERYVNGAYVGSGEGFKFGEVQDGDPMLNSEYGGVGAYAGDYDVSYCFKYMTDIQRRYEKQSGFVYTEPYDVEYERNGIMTYDRNMKVFGYDEIAYGGDMSMKDLTQEIYVGIVDQPMRNVVPGQKMKTKAVAIGWTNDLPQTAILKWRFDGTDIYGNQISTELSGEKTLNMSPYRKVTATVNYTAPSQACVGTLTVWLEDETGNKLAKNFTNIVVKDDTASNSAYTQENKDGSVVIKSKVNNDKMDTKKGTETQSYTYTLPEGFRLEELKGMRVLAEASSYKPEMGTDKNLSSYSSAYGQTAEGRERPSDLTVSVNGVELDTVYLPDDPRDMRGTLSLNKPNNGSTSAGDFGYLVNLNVTDEKLQAIKEAVGDSGEVTVTYQVKADAKNKNGFRIYSAEYGRYAVNPTLILNPADQAIKGVVQQAQDVEAEGDNYSVEAVLEKSESYLVRNDGQGGYRVEVSADGGKVALVNVKTGGTVADAKLPGGKDAYGIKATLFDEQIRVYVDNDPEPVIHVYDKSGFTGDVTANKGAENVVVSPESYEAVKADIEDGDELPKVDYADDFSKDDLDSRYEKMGNDLRANVADGELSLSAGRGDKLILRDMQMADGIYEADISVTNLIDGNGNVGFTFRSSNYQIGADGLDGYYAGIGNGFVQLGRMNNNWTELAIERDPNLGMGTSHRLKVAVFGSRIQVYVDGIRYIDMVDSTYTKGGAAIRGFQCSSVIDNIKITSTLNYTSDFSHGVGEWDENGTWKNEDGVYKTADSKASAFVDGGVQKDVAVAADLKAEDEDALPSIMFHASESAAGLEGYRAVLNVKEDKIQLVKSAAGKDTVIAERGWKLEAGTAYRILAEAEGSRLKVYLNGSEQALFSVKDTSFRKGMTGFYNGQGASVFDNLSISTDLVDGEVLAPVNTAGLDAVIAFAESLKKDNYTEESYAKMAAVLETAKGANRYTQEDVNQAAASLQEALLELVEKNSSADLSELQEALKRAEEAKIAAEKEKEAAQKRAEEAEKAKKEAEAERLKAQEQAEASKKEKEQAEEAARKAAKEAEEAAKKAEAAQKALKAAQKAAEAAQKTAKALQKELEQLKNTVKKGQVFKSGSLKYKVTDVGKKTVSVVGSAQKNAASVNIKATVKYAGKSFKVTAVAKNAFKNNKKLTKVVIGSYVTTIGSNAFYGNTKLKSVVIGKKVKIIGSNAFCKDSKLKNVTVKSNVLKSVGKNAFKGIQKKAYINVPNKKAKTYKKLFKNAGQPKSVTIK